jgi:hypothetical protein
MAYRSQVPVRESQSEKRRSAGTLAMTAFARERKLRGIENENTARPSRVRSGRGYERLLLRASGVLAMSPESSIC